MRWIALACVLTAGCDRLFLIERLPDVASDSGSHDGMVEQDSRGDGQVADMANVGDAPSDVSTAHLCPSDFTYNPVTGTYYKLVTSSLADWATARQSCRSSPNSGGTWFTHLVVLSDRAEYDYVYAMAGATTPWAGAYDNNNFDGQALFSWITSDPSTMLTWGDAQPDQPDTQNCARIWNPSGMDNENCIISLAYMCECDAYPDQGM